MADVIWIECVEFENLGENVDAIIKVGFSI